MALLMEGLFALQTKRRLGPACKLNIAHSAGVIGAYTLASDKLSDNIVEVVDNDWDWQRYAEDSANCTN